MQTEDGLLSVSHISRVTDIISAANRQRFCLEYLRIGLNEYETIDADSQFNHYKTLFKCLEQWKNKTEANGKNARNELEHI